MEFYKRTGKMALGSRLRKLSDRIIEEAAQVYALYDVDLKAKWFPVFFALSGGEEKTITAIATEVGHSHPSVSIIVKEMIKSGCLQTAAAADARSNTVKLTEKGLDMVARLDPQYLDVEAAVDKALKETQHDLWRAIEEWEFLLGQKSLLNRVKDERKIREAKSISVVPYSSVYKAAFKELNEQWITQYFKMEEADHHSLGKPEDYIINRGGFILVALSNGEPVGVCALIKMPGKMFELAKMAVSPNAKGRGVGYILGQAAIEKAKLEGAEKVHLESNTILKPAINLYHKLGFKKVTGKPSPYERCNIQMELLLS